MGWSERTRILEPISGVNVWGEAAQACRMESKGENTRAHHSRTKSQERKLKHVEIDCERMEMSRAHHSWSKSQTRTLEPIGTECEGVEVRLLEPVGTELAVCRPEFVSSRLACVRTYHTA
ncbi:hypothetical protein CDL15_Pgr011578 [Punica granatum]|uniref:Uncharacterized protein n=1 Tax=Punica granatum TaxID=22663 RepID=A0A218Y168_PUNGR|nr:hypothetical protein CDL15_Pgr011578 [Punica granatum]